MRHSIAVKTDGTLWSWGQNSQGQLGHDNTVLLSSPVQVGLDTDWSIVSAGRDHSFVLKTDGTIWSWGSHFDGRLGQNDAVSRSSPVQVGSETKWRTIFGAFDSSFATEETSGRTGMS